MNEILEKARLAQAALSSELDTRRTYAEGMSGNAPAQEAGKNQLPDLSGAYVRRWIADRQSAIDKKIAYFEGRKKLNDLEKKRLADLQKEKAELETLSTSVGSKNTLTLDDQVAFVDAQITAEENRQKLAALEIQKIIPEAHTEKEVSALPEQKQKKYRTYDAEYTEAQMQIDALKRRKRSLVAKRSYENRKKKGPIGPDPEPRKKPYTPPIVEVEPEKKKNPYVSPIIDVSEVPGGGGTGGDDPNQPIVDLDAETRRMQEEAERLEREAEERRRQAELARQQAEERKRKLDEAILKNQEARLKLADAKKAALDAEAEYQAATQQQIAILEEEQRFIEEQERLAEEEAEAKRQLEEAKRRSMALQAELERRKQELQRTQTDAQNAQTKRRQEEADREAAYQADLARQQEEQNAAWAIIRENAAKAEHEARMMDVYEENKKLETQSLWLANRQNELDRQITEMETKAERDAEYEAKLNALREERARLNDIALEISKQESDLNFEQQQAILDAKKRELDAQQADLELEEKRIKAQNELNEENKRRLEELERRKAELAEREKKLQEQQDELNKSITDPITIPGVERTPDGNGPDRNPPRTPGGDTGVDKTPHKQPVTEPDIEDTFDFGAIDSDWGFTISDPSASTTKGPEVNPRKKENNGLTATDDPTAVGGDDVTGDTGDRNTDHGDTAGGQRQEHDTKTPRENLGGLSMEQFILLRQWVEREARDPNSPYSEITMKKHDRSKWNVKYKGDEKSEEISSKELFDRLNPEKTAVETTEKGLSRDARERPQETGVTVRTADPNHVKDPPVQQFAITGEVAPVEESEKRSKKKGKEAVVEEPPAAATETPPVTTSEEPPQEKKEEGKKEEKKGGKFIETVSKTVWPLFWASVCLSWFPGFAVLNLVAGVLGFIGVVALVGEALVPEIKDFFSWVGKVVKRIKNRKEISKQKTLEKQNKKHLENNIKLAKEKLNDLKQQRANVVEGMHVAKEERQKAFEKYDNLKRTIHDLDDIDKKYGFTEADVEAGTVTDSNAIKNWRKERQYLLDAAGTKSYAETKQQFVEAEADYKQKKEHEIKVRHEGEIEINRLDHAIQSQKQEIHNAKMELEKFRTNPVSGEAFATYTDKKELDAKIKEQNESINELKTEKKEMLDELARYEKGNRGLFERTDDLKRTLHDLDEIDKKYGFTEADVNAGTITDAETVNKWRKERQYLLDAAGTKSYAETKQEYEDKKEIYADEKKRYAEIKSKYDTRIAEIDKEIAQRQALVEAAKKDKKNLGTTHASNSPFEEFELADEPAKGQPKPQASQVRFGDPSREAGKGKNTAREM